MSNSQVFSPLADWAESAQRPYVVAGPCGVESESQIHQIASELSGFGVSVLRGGIWKPRTRPGSFQGIGSTGLSWLKSAGVENGLLTATEVADPSHIEDALNAGIDMLWIGARSTVNPFTVQRIADALKGVDVPVMVKNPVVADLDLWIGALERLQLVGVKKIMAVHRGFASFEKSRYRNAPNWPIPIELKRRFPDLPLLCDPSHIAGSASLVNSVSQTAMDLNYDGLMVEVHHQPSEALSDKNQQLTPKQFLGLLQGLVLRSEGFSDVIVNQQVIDLRSRIDDIDFLLLQQLAQRMELSREIGVIKKESDVIIYQLKRWTEILSTRPDQAVGLGLNPDFIRRIFEIIHEESIHQQTDVMNRNNHPGEEAQL